MHNFLAKALFVHSRLWARDRLYRFTFVMGLPPVMGVLAGLLLHLPFQERMAVPPWMDLPRQPPPNIVNDDHPFASSPAYPLSTLDSRNADNPVSHGWVVSLHAMSFSPTYAINIDKSVVGSMALDGSILTTDQIIRSSPTVGFYAGVGKAYFVARQAGNYRFALHFQHSAELTANCLARVFFAKKQVSSYIFAQVGEKNLTSKPITFSLQPGLYDVAALLGCEREDKTAPGAAVTFFVQRPGDSSLQAPRADELVAFQKAPDAP